MNNLETELLAALIQMEKWASLYQTELNMFRLGHGPTSLASREIKLAHAVIAKVKASQLTGEETRALCDNCDKEHDIHDLDEYRDFWSRIEVGSETPVGDCPSCGAFCYVVVRS